MNTSAQGFAMSRDLTTTFSTNKVHVKLNRTTWVTELDDKSGARPQSETRTASSSFTRILLGSKSWCTIGGSQPSWRYLQKSESVI